jgi:hypothetical protein
VVAEYILGIRAHLNRLALKQCGPLTGGAEASRKGVGTLSGSDISYLPLDSHSSSIILTLGKFLFPIAYLFGYIGRMATLADLDFTPAPTKARHGGWGPADQREFIRRLARRCSSLRTLGTFGRYPVTELLCASVSLG